MNLTHIEREYLNGQRGLGARMAMSILLRMAEASGAENFIEISAAHIDSALYMGEATLEFAERLAGLGAKVAVPSTLNVSGLDEQNWQQWPVSSAMAKKALRQMAAYRQMGCDPVWTCAPYQLQRRPSFGQQVAWGESNAIAFINSVVGARTERYPDLLDICAAITGRVPAQGLHLSENRAGHILIRLQDLPETMQCDDRFYPLLGILVGKAAGDRIPVIDGLSAKPNEDQLKAFCAAAASAGGVALFHIIGVTPEAPSLEAAFQGRQPKTVVDISSTDVRRTYQDLTTAGGDQLDMVAIGCPHFSSQEFASLAALVAGKRCNPQVNFLIATNRVMNRFAEESGYLEVLRRFGAHLLLDTCILTMPGLLDPSIRTIMTNSGKYGYYTPGMLARGVIFASLQECVESAIAGRVIRLEDPWKE